MAITSSQILGDFAQRDGRRWIVQRFADQNGQTYDRQKLVAAAYDAAAGLVADATAIAAELTAAEIVDNIHDIATNGSLATPHLFFSTANQNIAALRAAYQSMLRVEAIMTGDYLNTLTDAQLQAAFGLTAGQVAALRTSKLAPAAALATQIRAAAGQ